MVFGVVVQHIYLHLLVEDGIANCEYKESVYLFILNFVPFIVVFADFIKSLQIFYRLGQFSLASFLI